MASLFNAFLSDSESDGGTRSKKKVTKPKVAQPTKTVSKVKQSSSRPQPVARSSNNGRTGKPTTMEPTKVGRQTDSHSSRGRGGRGRGRGPRPGDRDNRGKRFFDRQSGSTQGQGMKKGGGGQHNWGDQVDAQYNTNVSISIDNEHSAADVEKEAKLAAGVTADVDNAEAGEPEEPKEPEKETFTIDDFMKKKAEKRAGAGFEALKEAKVEEVAEGRAYAKKDKAVVETEDSYINFGGEKDKKNKKKGVSRATQRKLVTPDDLGFKVKNPDERSEFRGRGRGGFRGRGRGRGGFRGRPRTNRSGVDTSDQQNFPQLGAS